MPFEEYTNYLSGVNRQVTTIFGDLAMGIAVDFGNNIMTRAIRFSVYIQILVCTNPLTFLHLSNTMGTKLGILKRKELRIERKEDLRIRIKDGAKTIFKASNDLPALLERNGQAEISRDDARASITAMTNAYQLTSQKLRDTIFDDMGDKNSYKIWDIAMTLSKMAISYEFRDGTKMA